ncbi:hypothetical protein HK405_004710 [Cladochytrium tenue]|nr:hypothetical protein HK405_004710 [Cladochytrium tenue]
MPSLPPQPPASESDAADAARPDHGSRAVSSTKATIDNLLADIGELLALQASADEGNETATLSASARDSGAELDLDLEDEAGADLHGGTWAGSDSPGDPATLSHLIERESLPMAGFFEKLTRSSENPRPTWKDRYMVLCGSKLYTFRSAEGTEAPLATYSLFADSDVIVAQDVGQEARGHVLTIRTERAPRIVQGSDQKVFAPRVWRMRADSEDELLNWLVRLQEVIEGAPASETYVIAEPGEVKPDPALASLTQAMARLPSANGSSHLGAPQTSVNFSAPQQRFVNTGAAAAMSGGTPTFLHSTATPPTEFLHQLYSGPDRSFPQFDQSAAASRPSLDHGGAVFHHTTASTTLLPPSPTFGRGAFPSTLSTAFLPGGAASSTAVSAAPLSSPTQYSSPPTAAAFMYPVPRQSSFSGDDMRSPPAMLSPGHFFVPQSAPGVTGGGAPPWAYAPGPGSPRSGFGGYGGYGGNGATGSGRVLSGDSISGASPVWGGVRKLSAPAVDPRWPDSLSNNSDGRRPSSSRSAGSARWNNDTPSVLTTNDLLLGGGGGGSGGGLGRRW